MTVTICSNRFLPISRRRFFNLAVHFKRAAENYFGTKCKLKINASNFETWDIGEISKALWKRTEHFSVSAVPLGKNESPRFLVIQKCADPKRVIVASSLPQFPSP